MYPRPTCLNRPVYEGLDDVEINIRIHKILAHGAILKPGGGPTALREGVDCTRLSPLGSVFGCSCEFQFLNALMSLRRVSGVLIAHRRGVTLPEDVVRWKANHAHNERLRVWKQRR
jgi:hypothetical protein